MQLGELCERLGIPYRQARYVLEENILPPGVEQAPQRGNPRELTLDQAFWLGIVLKLKECGMKAPTANMVASLTAGMFGRADVRRWDTSFAPFQGRLTSNLNWYVELGDLRYIRLVAESANGETVYRGDWLPLDLSRPTMDVTPIVSIRVDLTQIARLLR
jgi:hypothetical protein